MCVCDWQSRFYHSHEVRFQRAAPSEKLFLQRNIESWQRAVPCSNRITSWRRITWSIWASCRTPGRWTPGLWVLASCSACACRKAERSLYRWTCRGKVPAAREKNEQLLWRSQSGNIESIQRENQRRLDWLDWGHNGQKWRSWSYELV